MSKVILLVDDEPDLMKVCFFRLKKAGYAVISAVNGQEALDVLKKNTPDIIFLDLNLPLIAGDEVCLRIKSDEQTKNIPVILFTASVEHIAEKAKECRADDYLIKPFEPETLFEKVKKFTGSNP